MTATVATASPPAAAADPATIGIHATADALQTVQRTAALMAVNAPRLVFAAAEPAIRGTIAVGAYRPLQAHRNVVSVTIWILVPIVASQHPSI